MVKDRYLQAVRGLAITAVVLIHCMPWSVVTVAVRPFLNWAVAMFFFLSGYLTDEAKVVQGRVLARRLRKTLPPYVFWSVVYAAALGHKGPLDVVKNLLTGGAWAHMYFLYVYAQLVVLTPILYRCLKTCRPLVYAVTPFCLIAYETATASGLALPPLDRLFPMWVLFYVMGLDWPSWKRFVEGKIGVFSALWAACLCLQLGEGFCWNAAGDYVTAVAQVKVSSMLCSLMAICFFMSMPEHARSWMSGTLLAVLGDLSFGVYLSHMAVRAVVVKLLGQFALPVILLTVLKWGLSLGLSCVFCVAVSRLLPRKVAGWIGC